jgi:UDP-glucose 4-epimerase
VATWETALASRHILVTGGAGYIGSHACKALAAGGYIPVTYDNFSTGWRGAVKFGPLVTGDLCNRAQLDAAFAKWRPKAIMHFGGLSQVGQSMVAPHLYWEANLIGSYNLLEAARVAGCTQIVFSSTAAVYGDQSTALLDEQSPQQPINAYSSSKRAVEDMLRDYGTAYGLRSVIFRYFNAAGADPDAEIGECHQPETHLIPLVVEAAMGLRDELVVYGTDYLTRDGTCLRDYVHVSDLISAHIKGLEWLDAGRESREFCLGTGVGFTVQEVIEAAEGVIGKPVPRRIGGRRAGDAVSLVANNARARNDLGWELKRSDLADMVGDAWRWRQGTRYQE